MANEKKAVCGGFLIGDGLQMDGKVLSATGDSGGYSYYFVNCKTTTSLPDHIPTLESIDETFSQMQENIANHKIPILYDDDYYLYYLTARDEYTLEFTSFYAYSINGAKDLRGVSITSPEARTIEIYDGDSYSLNFNQSYYQSITVTCKETDGVFNLTNIGGNGLNSLNNVNVNIILKATFADNHTVVASYSKRETNYAYFTAVNVTDTGVHYDYFKIRTNSAGTITYTSKDITI